MYIIKQIPEDFIVEEITLIEPKDSGIYTYFWLKKENYTTLKALELIANRLNIKIKDFGFAGTKDRIAITTQLCSAKNISREKIENINLKDIKTEYYGKGNEPISLGDLKGNKFTITVRNLESKPKLKLDKIPNYFGPQRFSKNNAKIGKAIIKRDWKTAVSIISKSSGKDEQKVKHHISKDQNDYIGAIKKINLKILKLFVHAYQSFIWNKTLEELETEEIDKIPIIGFGTELNKDKVSEVINQILNEEKINLRDFIVKQIPELSSEGDLRDAFVALKDFRILENSKDELNPEKYKQIISFFLQKSSYATVAIQQLYKSEE